MLYPAIIVMLAILLYQYMSVKVSMARGKYGIHAPAMSGNADFERILRVQVNTAEQLLIFLPAFWIFGYVSLENGKPIWACVIAGAAWLIGRILYAISYYKDSNKRTLGYAITTLATMFLTLGSLWFLLKRVWEIAHQ